MEGTANEDVVGFLPSLPNLRFFLPAPLLDELLLELLSLLFQRPINIFRSFLLSVSRVASSGAKTARAFVARLYAPRTFTNRNWHVATRDASFDAADA